MRKLYLAMLAMLLGTTVMAVSGTAAWAIDYPANSGSLTVSSSAATPGSSVTVSGSGFAPGASVQITIASTPRLLATTTAAADGSISKTVTIPSDLEAGTHTLSATGASPNGGTLVLTRTITLGTSSGGGGSLPFTGSNSELLGAVALTLLIAGGTLVIATRRRSRPVV